MMGSSSPLSPTFQGHIASTQDALVLFEACLTGALNHVARRPHDRERTSLIKSGNVFIYEEHSSGIKRWTDGVPWSPSRILGNFLIYRELERPFPPGEKKRAMKRNKRSPGVGKMQEPYGRPNSGMSNGYNPVTSTNANFDAANPSSLAKETERSLIGSLIDSYGFKEDGLIKKTVSVTVGGVSHHLVSYYTVADVMNNKLSNPFKDPRFQHLTPRPDLVTKQNFRTPIDEIDSMDRPDDRQVYGVYPYGSGYKMPNQSVSHRPMPLPAPSMAYGPNTGLYHGYGMTNNSYSDGLPTSSASNGYSGQFAPVPGLFQAPKMENHDLGGYRHQRYHPTTGINVESVRPQVAVTGPEMSRRPPNFDQSNSMDSNISGISSGSGDSKLNSEVGYASQGYYNGDGGLRDSGTAPNYLAQRSLPTPALQTPYDRSGGHPYAAMDNARVKNENVWPAGNTMGIGSLGHGHYMAAHPQQWASTGTS